MPSSSSSPSRWSRIAAGNAVLACLLALVGAVGARFGLLGPELGFRLVAGALVLGALVALPLGLVSLRQGRRPLTLFALAVGLVAVIGLGSLAQAGLGVPPIHDISTDLEDPPIFRQAVHHPDNQGRDLTHPHGGADVPAKQREGYPDLGPLRFDAPPAEVHQASLEAAETLGWSVTWSNRQQGLIEATETSGFFRFVDDIVVRVRPEGAGSRVDLRSLSRVGVSDLGANAERIRRFQEALTGGLEGGAGEQSGT